MAWVTIANLKGAPGDAAALGRFEEIDAILAQHANRMDGIDDRLDDVDQTVATAREDFESEDRRLDEEKIGQERIPPNRLEFEDDHGRPFLVVEGLDTAPHFRGSDTPTTEPITGDSFELVDVDGRHILAIDDLSTNPHFRGGAEQETHFIILAGQSNEVGVGTPSPVGTNDPLSNLFTIPQTTAGGGAEVQAVEPLSHPFNVPTAGTIGHGWTVARQYALEHPNVRVVILPLARTGSGFFYSTSAYTWAPSRAGEAGITNLYTEAIARANEAISRYEGVTRVAMFIWHQGEADSMGSIPRTQYEPELDALIAGLRSNITGASGAPFVLGQMGYEFREVRLEGTVAEINAAVLDTPNRVPGTAVALAPPAGFMQTDNTHFTGHGQKLLAQSYIDARLSAHFNV